MPTVNKSGNNEDIHLLCKKIHMKFHEIKHLNKKLDKFMTENFDYSEQTNINDLYDKLEETEYYFDELIYNYEKIKPLINLARQLNYEINKKMEN